MTTQWRHFGGFVTIVLGGLIKGGRVAKATVRSALLGAGLALALGPMASGWTSLLLDLGTFSPLPPSQGLMATPMPRGQGYIRPVASCPAELPQLVEALLRDLPGYANRVASRSLESPSSTVLIASPPDLEPLDLTNQPWSAEASLDPAVRQVFFTTLERQYLADRIIALQQYHWLFLVPDQGGWRLVLLYSSWGGYPRADRPPTPPQDSRQGIIGQAVSLWLRDCRAGAVSPLEAVTGE